MKAEGSFVVAASPARVWASFWDEALMPAWLPGCLHARWEDDSRVTGQVEQSVAQLRAVFDFDMRVSERDDERLLHLAGQGHGAAIGTDVALALRIALAPAGEGTQVTYVLDARIEGALANVGNFLLKLKTRELERDMIAGVQHALGA